MVLCLLWDFPSVCCEYVLLPLVNKEAALTYGMAGQNIARQEIQTKMQGKGGKVWEMPAAAEEARYKIMPQPFGNT